MQIDLYDSPVARNLKKIMRCFKWSFGNSFKHYFLLLSVTGGECKKRWKSIRDHYKREKKEEKVSTGSAAKKKRAIYWERLQFLDEVENERESFTNILPTSRNQQQTPTMEGDSADEVNDDIVPSEQTEGPSLQEYESEVLDNSVFQAPKSKRKKENFSLNTYLKEKKKTQKILKSASKNF